MRRLGQSCYTTLKQCLVRLWKGFNTWRSHSVHGKTRQCGLALHSGLFMLNEHMGKALLRIQDLCESAASSSPASHHLSRTVSSNWSFKLFYQVFKTLNKFKICKVVQ